jgi:hypothetical protein
MTYPAVPLGNQWAPGFVDETNMKARIDDKLNAMAANMSQWGIDFAIFRAIDAAAPANLNINIGFGTIVDDTSNYNTGGGPGWDAVNNQYTVQKTGLYAVQAHWRQSGAAAGVLELLTLPAPFTGIIFSGVMGTAAAYGEHIDVTTQLTAGTVLALRMRGAVASPQAGSGSARSSFTVVQIGY